MAIASFVFFGVKAIIDAAQIEDDGAGIAGESEEASETLQKSGLYGAEIIIVNSTLAGPAEESEVASDLQKYG